MIVKFCRANGMLLWLIRKFEPKKLPILLVRHPFAVAASHLKLGWEDCDNFQFTKVPFNDCYLKHENFLYSLNTKAERLVAKWCIINAPLLDTPGSQSKWITVFYENLLQRPQDEIARIFNLWGYRVSKSIEHAARRHSGTTNKSDPPRDVEEQLNKWLTYFDRSDLDRLMRVLSYFKIRAYGRDVRPLMEASASG
jgi:hypothetical protein